MKFSNALRFNLLDAAALPSLEDAEAALSAMAFTPCGPNQEQSCGFVSPREENGPFIESIGGHWLAKLKIETRSVPASAVKRAVEERSKKVEAETGRKPGKREKRELKEDIVRELMPRAFPKVATIGIWIDPVGKKLVLDTASTSKQDIAITAIVTAITGIALMDAGTVLAPAGAMSAWLATNEAPHGFTIDRDCVLSAHDESKAAIKYTNHALDIDEVRQHIAAGMRPTRLAMTYDGRVSFVLTEHGTVTGINFLDFAFEGGDQATDAFDADVAITTGELTFLLDALIEALGGIAQATITDAGEDSPAGVVLGALDRMETSARENGITATVEMGGVVLATLGDGPDPMYQQAVDLVRAENKPSISLVQRHLKTGYNRAAALIEAMEKAGVVSAVNASGQRTVIA